MSNSEIQGTKLVELYHRYVGEPESKRDVYGYWLFLLGSVAGMAGVTVFQVEQLLFAGDFQVREWAIALAAVGLTLTMFGVVVLLPVRQRGMQVSVVGVVVAALGIGGFVWAYPQAWDVQPDYSAPIIAVYSLGLAVIAGVAVLVPVVTGEKGPFVEPELGIGNDEPTPDRDGVESTVNFLKEEAPTADVVEIRGAAFDVYEEGGRWEWQLVDGVRQPIAIGLNDYADAEAAETRRRRSPTGSTTRACSL
jgi:hypothetical protein